MSIVIRPHHAKNTMYAFSFSRKRQCNSLIQTNLYFVLSNVHLSRQIETGLFTIKLNAIYIQNCNFLDTKFMWM